MGEARGSGASREPSTRAFKASVFGVGIAWLVLCFAAVYVASWMGVSQLYSMLCIVLSWGVIMLWILMVRSSGHVSRQRSSKGDPRRGP